MHQKPPYSLDFLGQDNRTITPAHLIKMRANVTQAVYCKVSEFKNHTLKKTRPTDAAPPKTLLPEVVVEIKPMTNKCLKIQSDKRSVKTNVHK